MRTFLIFIMCLFGLNFFSFTQERTLGLVTRDSSITDGYYTFSPKNGTKIYLIDNCGQLINTWETNKPPGNIEFIIDDGNIVTERFLGNNPRLGAGGEGGIFMQYDWDGNLIWEYTISDSFQLAHHDFSILPNGNLLILAWDYRDYNQSIQAGRDSSLVNTSVWSEKIVEIRPIFPDSAEIVWEWFLWDHLVQDYDPTMDNFGVVRDHPELLNINFTPAPVPDWLHANSVDYNPIYDEIIMSSRDSKEFYVIDHSTTTVEAAGSTGGNRGKGGDILFRWGNPIAYDNGDAQDQVFFDQHDVNWIDEGLEDFGGIMVFNTGRGRVGGNYSEVFKLIPNRDIDSNYVLINNDFTINSLDIVYQADPITDFYAPFLSGATQLEDGRIFITDGPGGELFEVDSIGNIIWKYIIPIDFEGDPLAQGTDPNDLIGTGLAKSNYVFRGVRYSSNFSGFQNVDLLPIGYVEQTTLASLCDSTNIVSVNEQINNFDIEIYPTILSDKEINISTKNHSSKIVSVSLFDISGQLIYDHKLQTIEMPFKLTLPNDINPGMYLLKLVQSDGTHNYSLTKKIMVI